MIQVKIDPRILAACPECRIGLIRATVINEPTSDELWGEIEAAAEDIKQRYELLEINQRPAIAATRHLYKALGKDPSRYRVSSEALCRRIIRGLGIYRLTSSSMWSIWCPSRADMPSADLTVTASRATP